MNTLAYFFWESSVIKEGGYGSKKMQKREKKNFFLPLSYIVHLKKRNRKTP